MKRLVIALVVVFCLAFLAGCSEDTKTEVKENTPTPNVTGVQEEKQTSGGLIDKIKDAALSGSYEQLSGLFSKKSKSNFSEEDYEEIKRFLDQDIKSSYYLLPGKCDEIIAFKINTENGKEYVDSISVINCGISPDVKEALDIPLEAQEPTQANISNVLLRSKYVYGIEWSPDKKCAAFVWGNGLISWGQMYLWEEGEKKAVKIYDVIDPCSLTWSPDGKYVLADSGTDYSLRSGYIVRREDKKSIAHLAYAYRALWSPDSKKVALATHGDPLTGDANNYTDFDETLDLSIYNVETNSSTVIKKGDQESMCILDKWLDSRNIQYIKSYIRSDKRDTLQCAVED